MTGDAVATDAATAVRATHEWLDRNSGWAPPDTVTIAEWWADGVCRCPDECIAEPGGWCAHGLASWWLLLSAVRTDGPPPHWDPALMLPHPSRFAMGAPWAVAALDAHEDAVARGRPGYADLRTGLFVMTAKALWDRGCCGRGCRHCPFFTPG